MWIRHTYFIVNRHLNLLGTILLQKTRILRHNEKCTDVLMGGLSRSDLLKKQTGNA